LNFNYVYQLPEIAHGSSMRAKLVEPIQSGARMPLLKFLSLPARSLLYAWFSYSRSISYIQNIGPTLLSRDLESPENAIPKYM
jgi:hypothetical protein